MISKNIIKIKIIEVYNIMYTRILLLTDNSSILLLY